LILLIIFSYRIQELLYRGPYCVGGSSGHLEELVPTSLFREKHISEIDEEKRSQVLTNTTKAMGIVAVLIATVTLPGGYYQSAHDGGVPGTPILAGSYAFGAFILADALAFICSGLTSFYLVFAGVPAIDLSVRYEMTSISAVLLRVSDSQEEACWPPLPWVYT
jgi:hypothetical protein